MKKITLTLAALLGITSFISAQDLYVSPNSYMFVQDEVVFVNDDVRLEDTNSNIYLRDGAQLVQNTDIKNSDIGELSVYQEQTTGVYEYNYWCSPVGVSDAVMNTNVNFDVTNLHKPTAPATFSDVSTATYGVSPYGYESTASQIKTYWLWQMQSGGGYVDWNHVTNTGNVATGFGFTLKGSPTANNTIDFRGRPNNGTLTIPCSFSGTDSDVNSGLDDQVETLTGNPYPSAMDLKRFLMHPTNKPLLDSGIYFWQQKVVGTHYLESYEGGYAVYTPGAIVPDGDYNNPLHANWADNGTYANVSFSAYNNAGNQMGNSGGSSADYSGNNERRYAAIGQGFMIRSFDNGGAAAGGNAIIENSMRLYFKEDSTTGGNGSVFGKTTENNNLEAQSNIVAMSHNGIDYQNIINNPTTIPEIRIHTHINDTYYRETVLAFRNNTDLTYNKFCDGKSPLVLDSDAYFIANEKKLVIKSIEYDIDTRLPFGLNADNETNTYSVTINALNNVSDNVEVFVHDKEEGTYTDIRNGAFEITLAQGEYDNRFEIVFKDASQEANEDLLVVETEVINSFDVFQNNTNNQLVIKNPKSHIVKSFTMYDVTGKLIYNKHNLGNETEYTFPTNTLSTGTYITKVTTDQNFEITKKVIVNN